MSEKYHEAELEKALIDIAALQNKLQEDISNKGNASDRFQSNQEDRLKKAIEFLNQENPDSYSAFMLFDIQTDQRHGGWLFLMSIITSFEISSKIFNPSQSPIWLDAALRVHNNPSVLHDYEKNIILSLKHLESMHIALDRDFPPSPVDQELTPLRQDDQYIIDLMHGIFGIQTARKQILTKYGFTSPKEVGDHFGLGTKYEALESLLSDDSLDQIVKFECVLIYPPWSVLLNSSWINYASAGLNNTEYYFYQPEAAQRLMTYGAIRFPEVEAHNCSAPSFRLGLNYKHGRTERIDHNASAFWFDIATKLGHGMAPLQAYRLLRENDERANDLNDHEFQKRLNDLLQKAEDMGQDCAQNSLTLRYAHGIGKWNDQNRIYAHYEDIIAKDFWAPPQISSILAYTLRAYLFDETHRSVPDLIEIVKRTQKDAKEFYDAEIMIPIRNLEEMLTLSQDKDYRNNSNITAKIIQKFYNQSINLDDFLFETSLFELPHLGRSDAFRDTLWLATELAKLENWHIAHHIYSAYDKFSRKYLGINEDEMKKSALDIGPFYNPIDPSNGLPILGEWLPPSQNQKEIEYHRVSSGAYTPMSGIIAVQAVKGVNGGSIQFICEESSVLPAKILDEDFDVILALCFGNTQNPLWPSLGLERKVDKVLDDKHKSFEAKVFNPAWLGYTDFGRTFYIVDALAGQITFAPKSFTVATPENSFDKRFPDYVRDFIEDLRFTGGARRLSSSKMINVSPEHIPLSVGRTRSFWGKDTWHVPLTAVKVRINGSYIRENQEGEEDRKVGWNDMRFAQGRLTQRLTDHYNDISLMMPVFERYRQLVGAFYAVMELRKQGFRLGTKEQLRVTNLLKNWESKPPLPRAKLIKESFPFKVDFI